MLTCLAWSLTYNEDVTYSIMQAAGLTITIGILLIYFFPIRDKTLSTSKRAFALVSLGWMVASTFGALPFLFSGYLPSFADAWFETVSGFTTTGASVVSDVEVLAPTACCSGAVLPNGWGAWVLLPCWSPSSPVWGHGPTSCSRRKFPDPFQIRSVPEYAKPPANCGWPTVIISLACALTFGCPGHGCFRCLLPYICNHGYRWFLHQKHQHWLLFQPSDSVDH